MHYLDYNEQIQHRTGDFPLAYYPVDRDHERYRMPMHWHREAELIRVKAGRLALYVDNRALSLSAGDLILIGEGVLHGGEPEDCFYECVVFDPNMLLREDACKRGLKPVLGHIICLTADAIARDPALSQGVASLYDAAASGVAGDELNVLGALYRLFAALARGREAAALDIAATQFSQKAEQLKPALEYIETHYGQQITLDALARLSGLSPKYFCRFFRTIVHRSPIDYVNYYRVECASHFLSTTDMTVAEIAQHCGYNDSSFFIKQFRKYKGTTPKQYKR
ncbi:MAG: helix-turn-helix transcriptional regulator [Clostridia bacterium]|nr:helix-turn-helix transcriptional regulator [Clostridia bacterium]